MNNKNNKHDLFEIIAFTCTFIVVAFIASAILAIIIKGIPSLKEAFFMDEVKFSMKLSILTATASTIICMALAIPTAYVFVRKSFPLKHLFQIIVELPLSMPYLVLGLSLLIIFSSEWGKDLKDMGFRVVFDKNGIIMAQTIVNLPYAIRIIRTAFEEIDMRLEYIAGLLGASKWKRFITITLPIAKNSLISAAVLIWSRGLGEFGATLMLVGTTRMKTETLPASIYLNMATGDISAAMASAIILITISFTSLFITNYLSSKRTNLGRIKDINI